MLWLPAVSVEVLNVAVVTPPVVVTATGAPRLLAPSLNCTVPVGEPRPPGAPATTLTVAVNVTDWPVFDDVGSDDVTATVVALVVTVCAVVPEVDLNVTSPL